MSAASIFAMSAAKTPLVPPVSIEKPQSEANCASKPSSSRAANSGEQRTLEAGGVALSEKVDINIDVETTKAA